MCPRFVLFIFSESGSRVDSHKHGNVVTKTIVACNNNSNNSNHRNTNCNKNNGKENGNYYDAAYLGFGADQGLSTGW